jgi:leucyl-tRNA synthetase
MPVDHYIGGAEHAVLHLLYSRFWHKVLYDLGVVSTNEPFIRLFNQGMILAYAYETSSGGKVSSDLVEERDGKFFHRETGEELSQIVAKMSKSLKNVVNPDEVVARYGADSLRLYEMFMGPLEERKPWSDTGVKGVFNFLTRVFRFFADPVNIVLGDENTETTKLLHQTIKKVGQDIENLKFNTAISALMVFNNHAMRMGKVTKGTAERFTLILSPFAPHIGEELWSLYGNQQSLAGEPWPDYDETLLKVDSFEYPVSFNGKLRFKMELPLDMTEMEIREAVLSNEKAFKWIENGMVKNFIIVRGKIINVVVLPVVKQ